MPTVAARSATALCGQPLTLKKASMRAVLQLVGRPAAACRYSRLEVLLAQAVGGQDQAGIDQRARARLVERHALAAAGRPTDLMPRALARHQLEALGIEVGDGAQHVDLGPALVDAGAVVGPIGDVRLHEARLHAARWRCRRRWRPSRWTPPPWRPARARRTSRRRCRAASPAGWRWRWRSGRRSGSRCRPCRRSDAEEGDVLRAPPAGRPAARQ